MSFEVAPEDYDSFMGRFAVPLAPVFLNFVGLQTPCRVLDVGCGSGALTAELAACSGPDLVSAVDPSETMVRATAQRNPGVEVRQASAEQLPFAAQSFDATLAQLVVHFMSDPVSGLREMARVTRAGGVVAACVWDHADGASAPLWRAAAAVDPSAPAEAERPGTREGDLARLFQVAGMTVGATAGLRVSCEFAGFEDWWQPFTLGVGGAGGYVARLDPTTKAKLQDQCRLRLPSGPFVLTPRVWAVRATVTPA